VAVVRGAVALIYECVVALEPVHCAMVRLASEDANACDH
jgi:hypothetical protein